MAESTVAAGISARTSPLPWLGYVLALVTIYVLYWLFPGNLLILTKIATLAILVMSLDLVTGYAGLPTLGHAAMFGVGAYGAGLWAKYVASEPLSGLVVASGSGALLALLAGLFLVRYQGLAFLMLTIAVSLIMQNLASKMQGVTGGDDGLSGFQIDPLLGYFQFDMFGVTGYWYSMLALLFSYAVLKRIMNSPFGLCCEGIRENRDRMAANGTRVYPHLVRLYVIAGAFAGLAGGLTAQVNQIVGLDTLGFELSAEALVMLVLGGLGHLWGGLVGTTVFTLIHHHAATSNPFHWLFFIGGLLMLVVFLPKGFARRYLQQMGCRIRGMFRGRA
jgi:branched-chain amino acid transport system permease protein